MINPIDLEVLYIVKITITYLEMDSELSSPCLGITISKTSNPCPALPVTQFRLKKPKNPSTKVANCLNTIDAPSVLTETNDIIYKDR